MKARWEVDDGYVGKSRPQETVLDDEIFDDAETESELRELVEEYVQQDFEQRIMWFVGNWDEIVQRWEDTKK